MNCTPKAIVHHSTVTNKFVVCQKRQKVKRAGIIFMRIGLPSQVYAFRNIFKNLIVGNLSLRSCQLTVALSIQQFYNREKHL